MNFEEQNLNREIQKENERLDNLKRPEQAKKIIDFFEKTKTCDFFKNLESKKENISFKQFKSFLIRLNGIARDIPIKQREFDGKNVVISGGFLNETFLPPKHEDKEKILEYAFSTAKTLNQYDNSYMLPVVINKLHMFNDGNGRTSRIMHFLLSDVNNEKINSDFKVILGENGRFEGEDINPDYINFEIRNNILKKHNWHIEEETGKVLGHEKIKGGIASALYPKLDDNSELKENLQKFQKFADSDIYYLLTAIVEALTDEKYEAILLKDESNPRINRKMISPENMKMLSNDDWQSIFNSFYKLKKEEAVEFVDIFKSPENHMSKKNKDEYLKDYFIKKIKEENKKGKKN